MSAKAKSKLTPEQRNATLRRVLEKIRPYGFFVVCSLIVAAVSVAAQLYIPILCGSAIDMMLGKGNVDFNGVLRIVVEIVIVAVVAAFAQWLLSVCNNRITFSVSRDLRNAALRKIQTLPLSYLDSHPSGDIVSRMVADVDTFADGLLMGFTQLFSGVLTILGTLLFMLSENVPITLVVVCITPLSLVVASFLAKRSYKYFQGQSTVRGEQTALVNEMIEGQKVVQAFGHEAESLAAFDEVNGRLQSVSLKAIFFSSSPWRDNRGSPRRLPPPGQRVRGPGPGRSAGAWPRHRRRPPGWTCSTGSLPQWPGSCRSRAGLPGRESSGPERRRDSCRRSYTGNPP